MGGLAETAALLDYEPGDAYDEAFAARGVPRPAYSQAMAAFAEADITTLTREVASSLRERGVSFGSGEPFRLCPVPRIVEPGEWGHLERALVQRARALAAFVADVYGDQEIVAAGRIPRRVVESADQFEPWMLGVPIPSGGFVTGLDLVRGGDGRMRVLEDNIRTPSGLAYILVARETLDRLSPAPVPGSRLDPGAAIEMLGAALRSAAPRGGGDPSVVLLSDGQANSAWYEHQVLASALAIPLVTPADLLVRGGRLHAMPESGRSRPVDVVYRRTDEDQLRDRDGRSTWLADLLLGAVRQERLAVVNPFGAGVADDKLVHAYVEEMVRFYLAEEPLMESVRTYDLGDPEVLEGTVDRLGELVIKPRSGFGGEGVVIAPHASAADCDAARRRVLGAPGDWVAQETIAISTHPTALEGTLKPRHVDLRPFVIGGDERAALVPGALTRVAYGEGALVVNSSQNGGGKDTWALA